MTIFSLLQRRKGIFDGLKLFAYIRFRKGRYTVLLEQFVKFGIIGVSNTFVSYALNALVLLSLRNMKVGWDYIAGNIVAFALSVPWAFYWNNKYVFVKKEKQERIWWQALLRTYLCYAFTGIILNNLLSWLWVTKMGISKFMAPVINIFFSVPLNFLLNKFWAYRA